MPASPRKAGVRNVLRRGLRVPPLAGSLRCMGTGAQAVLAPPKAVPLWPVEFTACMTEHRHARRCSGGTPSVGHAGSASRRSACTVPVPKKACCHGTCVLSRQGGGCTGISWPHSAEGSFVVTTATLRATPVAGTFALIIVVTGIRGHFVIRACVSFLVPMLSFESLGTIVLANGCCIALPRLRF